MNGIETKRLADIRMQVLTWSIETDTSTWEAPFLIKIIDEQAKELRELRKAKEK
jgi:hypothetical protein